MPEVRNAREWMASSDRSGCFVCGVPRWDHDLVVDCNGCGGEHRVPRDHRWLPPTRAQRERRADQAARSYL